MSKKDKKNADGPGDALSPEQERQRKYAAQLVAEFKVGAEEEQERQRKYASGQSGRQADLVVARAFVKGMRDLGYKNVGTAFDELVDNCLQSAADKIQLVFGYDKDNKTNPVRIAVVDNGHGMGPAMLQLACLWGGTHREDDRNGFGRYGYGLPSASVYMAKRFTVYSREAREEGGDLYRVVVDLDEIEKGPADDNPYYDCGRVVIPDAEKVDELPGFLADQLKKHGTIVLLEKLDRIWPRSASKLRQRLISHFGLIYRNFLGDVHLSVDGTRVEPIDPLFTTPGARLYDLRDTIAGEKPIKPSSLPTSSLPFSAAEDGENNPLAHPPSLIEVKGNKDRKTGELRPSGTIRVRYSEIPAEFGRKKFPDGKKNPRHDILKNHKGLIVMRRGRQIDVVRPPWSAQQNYDTCWGIEIDFSPSLDEEFSLNTSKQQVVVSERIWEILQHAGVPSAMTELRALAKKSFATLKDREESNPDVPRASETVMAATAKRKTKKPGELSPEAELKVAEKRWRRQAKEIAEETGETSKDAIDKLVDKLRLRAEERAKMRPYMVKVEDLPRAPFFRVQQLGGQRLLLLNKAHRFYTDIYAGPGSDPRLQAGLELLLFAIGDGELDASGEDQRFYEREVVKWSTELSVHLGLLEEKGRFAEDAPEEVVAEGKAASAE